MEYLLILLLLIALAVYFLQSKNVAYGTPEEKKEQIRMQYIKQMQDALNSAQDKDNKRHIKMQTLKNINDELSRNIFFDPHESKELLQRLSALD